MVAGGNEVFWISCSQVSGTDSHLIPPGFGFKGVGGMSDEFLLVIVFLWTWNSGLYQLSIFTPFFFPHDCYTYVFWYVFPISIPSSLSLPYSSTPCLVCWVDMITSDPVTCFWLWSLWQRSELSKSTLLMDGLDNWDSFWVLNSDWLRSPILDCISTFQYVAFPLPSFSAWFWRELGRRDSLRRLNPGKLMLSLGEEY